MRPRRPGLIRALAQADRVPDAQAALDAAMMNPALADDPQLANAKAAVELAGNKVDDSELAALRDMAQGNPADMDARLAYAEAAFAAGEHDAAADELLGMVEADREWNEGAARSKLLDIFERRRSRGPMGGKPRAAGCRRSFSDERSDVAFPSFRCPERSCFPGCNYRCTSSNRAIANWSVARLPRTA